MKLNSLAPFFPTPDFLCPRGVGLDISDRFIKFLELIKTPQGYRLGRHGELALPPGVLAGGAIKQPDKYKEILIDLRRRFDLTDVFLSLPDDQAYIFSLDLPALSLDDLAGSVELQIEEHVPLPIDEVVFDFEVIKTEALTGEVSVGVVALPKNLVVQHEVALEEVGINLLAIEDQGNALIRSLLKDPIPENLAIVDLGRTHTAVYWVNRGVVVHSAAAPVGGEAITHNIEKSMQVDFAQAEKMKMTQGLLRSDANRPVFEAIIPVVSAIREEIQKFTIYWGDKKSAEAQTLEKIILVGGQSSLPGLAEYLTNNLACPVEIANPWIKIFPSGYNPGLSLEESLRFGTALGLALRNYV